MLVSCDVCRMSRVRGGYLSIVPYVGTEVKANNNLLRKGIV